MSQTSSQFTYNPSSLRSTDAHTIASFAVQEGNIEINLEEWQKAAVVSGDDEVAVPFGGQDISAIEHKKDLSLIVEGESESPTPIKKGRGSSNNNNKTRFHNEVKACHSISREATLYGAYLYSRFKSGRSDIIWGILVLPVQKWKK
jgi:hypothetical protein